VYKKRINKSKKNILESLDRSPSARNEKQRNAELGTTRLSEGLFA